MSLEGGGVQPADGLRRFTPLEQGEFVLSREELNQVMHAHKLAGHVHAGVPGGVHGNDSHGDGGVVSQGWNEECDCGGIGS